MNWHTLTTLFLAAVLLVVDPVRGGQLPPGGYRNFVEARGPEPQTGELDRKVGTLLSSLGAIRAVLGAGTYVLGLPQNCSEIALGNEKTPRRCMGALNYGIAGMALGGTMLITGLVYLVISRRKDLRHRKWKNYSVKSMLFMF